MIEMYTNCIALAIRQVPSVKSSLTPIKIQQVMFVPVLGEWDASFDPYMTTYINCFCDPFNYGHDPSRI